MSQHHHKTLAIKLKMSGFSNVKIQGSGKVSNYLGYHIPFINIYGSYLISGDKFWLKHYHTTSEVIAFALLNLVVILINGSEKHEHFFA